MFKFIDDGETYLKAIQNWVKDESEICILANNKPCEKYHVVEEGDTYKMIESTIDGKWSLAAKYSQMTDKNNTIWYCLSEGKYIPNNKKIFQFLINAPHPPEMEGNKESGFDPNDRPDPNEGSDPNEKQFVKNLTRENWDQLVGGNHAALVAFSAPWCVHCKEFNPILEEVGKHFDDKRVIIAKCDATQQKELADKYDIVGYPTVKFFPKRGEGKETEYTGPRDKDSIVEWIINELSKGKKMNSG